MVIVANYLFFFVNNNFIKMYEDDPKEESSFSQDLSIANVPHMIISGNLKDGSKEGNHACVTRFCTIKITRLGN